MVGKLADSLSPILSKGIKKKDYKCLKSEPNRMVYSSPGGARNPASSSSCIKCWFWQSVGLIDQETIELACVCFQKSSYWSSIVCRKECYHHLTWWRQYILLPTLSLGWLYSQNKYPEVVADTWERLMGWFSKPSDIQIEALYMAYDADTIEVLGKP